MDLDTEGRPKIIQNLGFRLENELIHAGNLWKFVGLKLKQNGNDVGWFVLGKLGVVDVMG